MNISGDLLGMLSFQYRSDNDLEGTVVELSDDRTIAEFFSMGVSHRHARQAVESQYCTGRFDCSRVRVIEIECFDNSFGKSLLYQMNGAIVFSINKDSTPRYPSTESSSLYRISSFFIN